jgi:hypothetical protein
VIAALWSTPIPSGQKHYYDGMLYLLSLRAFHIGWRFRRAFDSPAFYRYLLISENGSLDHGNNRN